MKDFYEVHSCLINKLIWLKSESAEEQEIEKIVEELREIEDMIRMEFLHEEWLIQSSDAVIYETIF